MCDGEAPERGPAWHSVARNAAALEEKNTREEISDLLHGAASTFAYHPGSFIEVHVVRADPNEQLRANERLDQLKDRVSTCLAELRSESSE